MIRFVIVAVFIAASFLWGDWKRWKEYYPTVLYVIIGDITYNLLFYQYSLWIYTGFINNTFADLAVAFVIFPCTVNLYLVNFPKKPIHAALYVLFWTALATALEYISIRTGCIAYDHGWNLFWSALLCFIAFILIKVHDWRPLVAWPISFACGIATLIIFKIPFSLIK